MRRRDRMLWSILQRRRYHTVAPKAASAAVDGCTSTGSLLPRPSAAVPAVGAADQPDARAAASMLAAARASGWSAAPTAGTAADGRGSSEPVDVQPSTAALAAFGATVWYLRRCKIDHSILSLRRMARYQHAD